MKKYFATACLLHSMIPTQVLASGWDLFDWFDEPAQEAVNAPMQQAFPTPQSSHTIAVPLPDSIRNAKIAKRVASRQLAQLNHVLAVHLDAYRHNQWLWAQWLPKHTLREGNAVWSQFNSQYLNQKQNAQQVAFKGMQNNLSVGYQWLQNKDLLWGIGADFAELRLMPEGERQSFTKVSSVQALTFVNMTFVPNYIDLAAALTHHNYTSKEYNLTQKSPGQQLLAQAEFGRVFELAQVNVAPFVQTQYSFLTKQHLSQSSQQSLGVTVGAKFAWHGYYFAHQLYELRLAYGNDLAVVQGNTLATHLQDNHALSSLLSVSFLRKDKPFLMFAYEYQNLERFQAHGANLKYYFGW